MSHVIIPSKSTIHRAAINNISGYRLSWPPISTTPMNTPQSTKLTPTRHRDDERSAPSIFQLVSPSSIDVYSNSLHVARGISLVQHIHSNPSRSTASFHTSFSRNDTN
eukprot:scaffold96139_cov33-Cyclotella_meneghiniana.AAC.2